MKSFLRLALLSCALTCLGAWQSPGVPRVLIFSKTAAFRHESIPDGIAAIRQLGGQNGFEVDATEDMAAFTDANLARYRAVVFLNTTGEVFSYSEKAAFQRFITNGGGFVGVHSATDTLYDWAWYGGLVGAYFKNHPAIQRATIKVEDATHPSTDALPTTWERTDEWYNFRSNPRGVVKVLATLNETTYNGGEMGGDHPIAWCQRYAGGRSWYTAGGHTKESYAEPLFRQHLLGGIQFAAGIKEGACAALTATSAASFQGETLAPESIVAIFGDKMAATTQAASTIPLPQSLAETSVSFKDAAGMQARAPLLFVSPTQINLLVPGGLTSGAGVFVLEKARGVTTPSGVMQIATVAPALFAANANGQGVAAGVVLRARGDTRSFEPLAVFDATQNRFVTLPIDLGPATDEVFLILFGTGLRFRPRLDAVTLKVGGVDAPITFAGAQNELVGLDQINARLPRALIGRGDVDVMLSVDGKIANTVRVRVQ